MAKNVPINQTHTHTHTHTHIHKTFIKMLRWMNETLDSKEDRKIARYRKSGHLCPGDN